MGRLLAQQRLSLQRVEHAAKDNPRVVLKDQHIAVQVGHVLRLFMEHAAEEGGIGLLFGQRAGGNDLHPLVAEPLPADGVS